MATLPALDFNNVQGDILEGIAKKHEVFYFFRIRPRHIPDFRAQLSTFLPSITSVAGAKGFHKSINDAKEQARKEGKKPPLLKICGVNVAFSQKGLDLLGITENIGDDAFKKGMLADAEPNLLDDLSDWDRKLKEDIHGVILIAGDSKDTIDKSLNSAKDVFHVGNPDKAGIEEITRLEGHIRPDDEAGHEHFGFNDGLSQPFFQGVGGDRETGQQVVRPGIILVGREGDEGIPDPGTVTQHGVHRPDWALDGSFLVVRKLKQLVPEFDAFLHDKALSVGGAELLGARLIGRWKSGAPVDLTPLHDDKAFLAKDKVNNFTFDTKSQVNCPFAAHIRKNNPRADLDSLLGEKATELRRIFRRGIPYGPEVTDKEAKAKKSSGDDKLERGLLFACYQSNIGNGFQFQQQTWSNNVDFPPLKNTAVPPIEHPGLDPIIGVAAKNTPREMVGSNPDLQAADTELVFDAKWVIPRGGEYFFSPSISALKTKFANTEAKDEL
ncbi:peroxidase TAP [Xylariales sp. AK1849]|nr:peroxidase TAP [Xylariales sp. AK1849]